MLDGSLPALRELGVDEDPLGDAGIAELVAGYERLAWLNLAGTELDDHAAMRIAEPFTTTTSRRTRSRCEVRACGITGNGRVFVLGA